MGANGLDGVTARLKGIVRLSIASLKIDREKTAANSSYALAA